MLAIFFLALASTSLFSQSNFWEPLNGPDGVQQIQAISSDGSGRLFMYMNYQIHSSTDNGDSWNLCMNGIGQNIYNVKFLKSPSGTFYAHLGNEGELYRYLPASDSWTTVSLPFSGYKVDGIDIDPQGRFGVSTDASYNVVHWFIGWRADFPADHE
ncbi:MAG: hypothetical protein OHK0019_07470 [Saprospiraceae bacterium]